MNRRDFLTALLGATAVGATVSGCASFRSRMAWIGPRRRVLKPDASLTEVVDELNRNILGDGVRPGLAGWRSDHVRVSFGPMAMLSGTLAVQNPRNFRMQVALPVGGNVADFGSNGHEYWWWTKEQEVLAVGHHDEPIDSRCPVPVPFEPEWLLDVLGVAPVSDQNVSIVRLGPKTDAVELVREAIGSGGKPVTRVRRVRLSTGEVIGHEIRSQTGVTIARAEVVQHVRDRETGVLLPQKVHVSWPGFGVNFTLHVSGHEINPANMTASTFDRPTHGQMPVVYVTRPGDAVVPVGGDSSHIKRVVHDPQAAIDAF